MKLVWVQDFLAVADTGALSHAAALRHSSQPALSRRIQAFEQWLGVDLIDRRQHPIKLTPVAQRRLPEWRALASQIEQLRIRMQSDDRGAARLVLATQHSLTITRLPDLLEKVGRIQNPSIDLSVLSENHDQCLAAFISGDADLLMCMEDSDEQLQSAMPGSLKLTLGYEKLIPVSAVSHSGGAVHSLGPDRVLKLLAFPVDSFVGRALYRRGLSALMQECKIQVVHESIFLAGIKEMVMAGLGAAWLPETMVRRELASEQLTMLKGALEPITLPVTLYGNPHTPHAAMTLRVWRLLSEKNCLEE